MARLNYNSARLPKRMSTLTGMRLVFFVMPQPPSRGAQACSGPFVGSSDNSLSYRHDSLMLGVAARAEQPS